jgi:nucleotide-binding universal stress UspA family protein
MLAATRILVATDFSESAETAWLYGRELAAALSATLHVVHVASDLAASVVFPFSVDPEKFLEPARIRMAELLQRYPGPGPVTSEILVALSPAKAIMEYARSHDINLIIVGTHGHGAIADVLLGGVAETVVRSAKCPVLTVRHPEREFAVPDAVA